MRAINPLFAKLGLALAAALSVTACARSIDMSVASVHQRAPEFDFLLYQDGWACLSQGAPNREAAGSSCPPTSGRQLRDLFAQRSTSRSLRDYLTENGASCRSDNDVTMCSYTKALAEAPLPFGRAGTSRDEGLELTVSFPAKDLGLAPEQIRTALRRFTRTLKGA
jgi:hypothetical protein